MPVPAAQKIGHELWPLAPDVGWWEMPDAERASGYDAFVQLAALVRVRVSVLRDALREHQADLRRALQ